jgi:CoA:oxalate CoA-transferase
VTAPNGRGDGSRPRRDAGAPGALDGLLVLDLTTFPHCTMVLGDMGAEVIKVERPDVDEGDAAIRRGRSQSITLRNRSKRLIVLDFKDESDRSVL